MLVLSRKTNESIMIDNQIEVVVVSVEGDVVKLGIRAPKEVEIFRKEIYLNIQAANKEASTSSLQLRQLSKLFENDGDSSPKA
ncbi:carbon storage regulator CsrA [Paenibacillus xanthanilyticus]|uniref:Translational regulator CsrA n=1 Tax=Paenibacillus xanthanilyticus TaxID=1783531 RepID=A0ABV8K2V7_9BACL